MDATNLGQTKMESVVLAEQKINSSTSHTIDLRQSEMGGMITSSTDSPASECVKSKHACFPRNGQCILQHSGSPIEYCTVDSNSTENSSGVAGSDEVFRFTDLPGELKNKVFNCALIDEDQALPLPGLPLTKEQKNFTALLATSKQIRKESKDLFYNTKCITLDLGKEICERDNDGNIADYESFLRNRLPDHKLLHQDYIMKFRHLKISLKQLPEDAHTWSRYYARLIPALRTFEAIENKWECNSTLAICVGVGRLAGVNTKERPENADTIEHSMMVYRAGRDQADEWWVGQVHWVFTEGTSLEQYHAVYPAPQREVAMKLKTLVRIAECAYSWDMDVKLMSFDKKQSKIWKPKFQNTDDGFCDARADIKDLYELADDMDDGGVGLWLTCESGAPP
ncbi:hypothetical protein B0A49_08679 [Cryomyces minteri]|uniref:Uncharacterized protein n=1 Tax=Cryomyces minteri TaxID=331657 RepID=A0A4V5NE98_9PEZI|nr:hypothetical protein B0A49_08679 [Cryomyces minteri]